FQDWLSRRTGINDVNIRWGLTQTHLPNMEVAARLVPTWPREDPPDGSAWLVDPVEHQAFQVIARRCRIWADYDEFRSDSLKRAMSQVAAAIRSAGPCVPVVYTWTGYQPLFENVAATNGYDGIAPALRGHGAALATQGGGPAFSQAEHAAMDWWLFAGRVGGSPTDGAVPAGPPALMQDWAALRDV